VTKQKPAQNLINYKVLTWLSVWSEAQMIMHMVQLIALPPHNLLLQ